MNETELAILMTGLVGIGAPWVAHIFTAKRENTRLEHERTLHRRDAVNTRLDDVAERLDTCYP